MWRLKEEHYGKDYILKQDLEIAIMKECGFDQRTIRQKIKALKAFKWIRCDKKKYIINYDADLD